MSYAEDAFNFAMKVRKPFSLAECVAAIAKDGKVTPRRMGLAEQGLEPHPNVYPLDEDTYAPRSHYFNGAKFRIAPRAEEIEQGVLFIGHRFIPFVHPEAPLDEIDVLDENGEPIPPRSWTGPVEEIGIYHSLLPLSRMPFRDAKPLGHAELKVLDMASWYQRRQFAEGDTIVATVLDLDEGRYQIRYAPLSEMQQQIMRVRRSDVKLEEALAKEARLWVGDTDLDTQVFYAYVEAGQDVLQHPGRHLGGLLSDSRRVTWTNDGYIVCLHAPDADPHEQMLGRAAITLAEDRRLDGTDIESILARLGSSVTLPEVRAMAYCAAADLRAGKLADEAAAKKHICSAVFPTAPGYSLPQPEHRLFIEQFEKLWREIVESERQRPTPLPVDHLRRSILTIQESIRAMLRRLDELQVELEDLPASEMVQLAHIDHMLAEILDSIETDKDAPKMATQMASELDQMAPAVHALIRHIETSLQEP